MIHDSNWTQRLAMARLAIFNGANLEVLTGSRFQLARATAAYHVLREHVPPRPDEDGLSINHSSSIYIIGPDTMVAGYGYHDMDVGTMAELVEHLSLADRNPIDRTAIRQRYITGICGE